MESSQLEEVRTKIAAWRKENRGAPERAMPAEIWKEVLVLVSASTVVQTAAALGIQPSGLYRRLRIHRALTSPGDAAGPQPEAEFVEIEREMPPKSAVVPDSTIEMTWERGEGFRLSLRFPGNLAEPVGGIIAQFLKAA